MSVLVLQRGHCYRTTGATGTTGEQAFATAVANAAMVYIHGLAGWVVRSILADAPSSSYQGDAFVAVHCDGSIHASARGASAGYTTPEGQAFAQAWKAFYRARGWIGGFRPDNYTSALQGYYGTRLARGQGNRVAFILEAGFLTSPADRDLLHDRGAERVALALADALGIRQPVADQPAPDQFGDLDMVRLVHGSNRDIIPNSASAQHPNGVAYGDLVFLMEVDIDHAGMVQRRYVPLGALFTLLVKLMGPPVEVDQKILDAVPWPNAATEAPAYLR